MYPAILAALVATLAVAGCGSSEPTPVSSTPPVALAEACAEHAERVNRALTDLGTTKPTQPAIDALDAEQAKLANAARATTGRPTELLVDYSVQGHESLERLPAAWAKSTYSGQVEQTVAMRAGNAIVDLCVAEMKAATGG